MPILPLILSLPALNASDGVSFHDNEPDADIDGRLLRNTLLRRCHAASLFAVARNKSGRVFCAWANNSSNDFVSWGVPIVDGRSAISISWLAGNDSLVSNVPLAISRLFFARSRSKSRLANVVSAFNTSALAT